MRTLRALLLAGLVVAASVLTGRPAAASASELVQQLDQLAEGFPGGVGLFISDPIAGKTLYTKSPDEPVITASLYKLGVLLEAERRVDAGELKYTDVITIEPDDVVEDGSFEPVGTELTVDEALEKMITVSDNGAAQALWRVLGPANIDATLVKVGIANFHVALDHDEDNVATPRAIATFFTMLANKTLVSAAASDRMLARLERQEINDRLPASLPDGVVVAHKTGNLPALVHDAGIIFTPSGPRVVVAMTWDDYEADANAFIANVGSLVYAAVLEPPANARFGVPRTPVSADTGSKVRVTLTVTNAGSAPWAATGAGAVGLIWELDDDDDAKIASSAKPLPLPALAPAKAANLGLEIPTPAQPGLFHVTVGLADAAGNALESQGSATATFDVKAHAPFLVHDTLKAPMTLHRGEASLLVASYQALGTAGLVDHELMLAWHALDTRNGRTVEEGFAPVGTLHPGASGSFFFPLVAPNIVGRYRLAYELVEDGAAVSETTSTLVTIDAPRTYPDDEGGRTPGALPSQPTPAPSVRLPFPPPSGSIIPRIELPTLPLPKGKSTPAPTPQ
ncbi:MAG TPA: serine hydrolase [Candidatus Limnocylindria bacterium]